MIRSKIASPFKRAKTMGFLWAWLALALHVWPGAVVPTHAQGTRKDDIVFNSRGIPLAGATVRVCVMPASGQPCTPLALLYSDSALTQANANPTTTDGLGNYFFYAAPGKYEIEISGPGITTKQLPNVVLPNDPSSPTFSGAISAFSLNLTGNLAVTGNTTVIGSLASGTLNLSNQGTPPGAASAGTVNLYTKTADKRLYYKDDTGTEIGPIATGGSGAQLNVVNTFTATQNFDSDVETKGPNPNFSLSRYGGYNSTTATPPSTTGSISSSSTTLTLASAQDFANGQGIVIYRAGAATALTTPGTPTVTPINLVNGSTTYSYEVVGEDRSGGLTTSSGAGGTTTGAATLGANTVTLTQCVRTNGVATYTSTSPHNLQAGTQIEIKSFGGGVFDSCNGVKTIATTPTGSTFTTQDGPALANETDNTGSPTATVWACNQLTFPSGTYSGPSTIHYWIYRQTGGSGAYSLIGVAQGVDPWYQDCGYAAPNTGPYVPLTAPSSAQNGYLATTITAGGGTTTLTLAASAGNTVSGATVLHDNSVPLLNAVQAADNNGGGTAYIPSGGSAAPYWVFNATTDFTPLVLFGAERVHINSNAVLLNNPWIAHAGLDFEGEPHVSTSFSYVNGSQVIANSAYPMFLMGEFGDGIHFDRLLLHATQSQQTAVLADEASDGGGTAGAVFDDVDFNGSPTAGTVVIKGGFDFFFNRGNCQGGALTFSVPSCLQLTDASPAVTAGGIGQVAGRVKVNGLYFAGNAIDIDCLPDGTSIAPVDFTFSGSIYESQVAPYLRVNCSTGFFSGFIFNDVVVADTRVGFGTPVIDAQNDNDIGSFTWTGGALSNALMPGVISPSSFAGLLLLDSPFENPGNISFTTLTGSSAITTGEVAASGTGRVEEVMPTPAGVSLALSAGGSIPVGTWYYAVQYEDVDGNFSALSPQVSIATTSGNQTVTITPPAAPAGAIGFYAFRSLTPTTGYSRIHYAACSLIAITTSPVDTDSFSCGNGAAIANGGSSIVGPNGLSGQALRLVNNGNILTFSTPITANRTITLPDVSGVALVTGYTNAAFDNATRANGAIGSNWTVTNANTINIASDNFVGTGANSVAFWNANTFNPSQFSQATLTALNGTTDFPGVVTLMSGSVSGAQGYECIEDTTNIFLQKISGTSNTTLTSAATTGAAGDILRLEAVPGATSVALMCYKNGVSTLTTTDSSSPYLTGAPGLFLFGTVATSANWSGGNLHPFAQLDSEQSWTKAQHLDGNALSCTMSSSTTCTATLTSARWHACNAQVQGTSPIAAACSISGTTLTVTAASSNSQIWGIFLY